MTHVYIASPYTIGDVAVNVREQMRIADQLMDRGYCPVVPLYSHFQHMYYPRPYDSWMEQDKERLARCDVVLRLPGESRGADIETDEAYGLGIPVFFSLSELFESYPVVGPAKKTVERRVFDEIRGKCVTDTAAEHAAAIAVDMVLENNKRASFYCTGCGGGLEFFDKYCSNCGKKAW